MANTAAEGATFSAGPMRVAAAVIRRADGAVLLSLRPPHADQGGLWEFPGGKLAAREREVDGLARELREELGITIRRATPVIRVLHCYPDKQVSLAVLEVVEWQGTPSGREGQEIRWVRPADLGSLNFPAANLPVTMAVGLPRLALVTPPVGESVTDFLARLERCLSAGVRLVQLRPQEPDDQRRRRVARAAADLCRRHDARLMLNGVAGEAIASGAHGLHLSWQRLRQLSCRPLPSEYLLSAACHNVAELRHAEAVGVDFAYVSPVHVTGSHPTATPLGWHGLYALTKATRLPVFALGGMRASDTRLALRAGCQGIAMMSGIWDSQEPAEIVRSSAQASRAAAYAIS